jgi:hypothetical protein
VAKNKNSLALFEAIAKSKEREKPSSEGMAVPRWMGAQPQGGHPSQDEPAKGASPDYAPASGHVGAEAQRVTISVTRAGAAAALAAVVVVVALAFVAGRMTAKPAAQAAASVAPPIPAPEENSAGTGNNGSLVDKLPERVAGKYYLVIQKMKGDSQQDREDALKIATWLTKEKDEPAEVCQNSGRTKFFFVWSFKAMDSDKGQQADAYAKKIEELGQEYKRQFGRYWFGQPRDRQGRTIGWYIPK